MPPACARSSLSLSLSLSFSSSLPFFLYETLDVLDVLAALIKILFEWVVLSGERGQSSLQEALEAVLPAVLCSGGRRNSCDLNDSLKKMK